MKTTTASSAPRPSPLKVILHLIFRERARRGPAAIELDVIAGQCERERTLLTDRSRESDEIEAALEQARVDLAAALTDAHTPGILTAAESRTVCAALTTVALTTHDHTAALKSMAS